MKDDRPQSNLFHNELMNQLDEVRGVDDVVPVDDLS